MEIRRESFQYVWGKNEKISSVNRKKRAFPVHMKMKRTEEYNTRDGDGGRVKWYKALKLEEGFHYFYAKIYMVANLKDFFKLTEFSMNEKKYVPIEAFHFYQFTTHGRG